MRYRTMYSKEHGVSIDGSILELMALYSPIFQMQNYPSNRGLSRANSTALKSAVRRRATWSRLLFTGRIRSAPKAGRVWIKYRRKRGV